MNGRRLTWQTWFGQCGQVGFGAELASVQPAVPSPLVQPGAPTSPSALDQPPEYQAQLTPAPVSSSPIVVPVWGGSCGVPLNGWYAGWVVLAAKSPQATFGLVVARPHACVPALSDTGVVGV